VSLDRSSIEWLEPSNPVIVKNALAPEQGRIPLGRINVHSDAAHVVGLLNEQLNRHGLLVGSTGTGKSECSQWLVLGMVKAGYPVIVVDPHGQLHDALIRNLIVHAPEHAHRITSVDLTDEEHPVALNPLDVADRHGVEPRVSEIMDMMASQMQLSAGSAPRALNYAGLALTALCEANLALRARADTPLCTLLHVPRFFTDTEFRRLVCEMSENTGVREAFDPETGNYEQLTEKMQAEHVSPLMRAFQPLQRSQLFSNSLGASQNKLDWTRLMKENKVVIVKLARMSHQKKLGEFVGQLLLPMIRGSMDEWGRKKDPRTGQVRGRGCRIVIDEAATVIGSDGVAESLFAEARKWDVSVLPIAQYLSQFEEAGGEGLVKAIVNNTVSKIALNQPPESAVRLASAMKVDKDVIATLPDYHAIVSSPVGAGRPSAAYTVQLLRPLDETPPLVSMSAEERERRYDEVVARSQDELTNPAEQTRTDVLQATSRITEALGLILVERTLAPPPPAPDPAPAVPAPAPDLAPAPVQPVSAAVAPQPGSRITGASEAWQFGEFDEFDLETGE
jgi:hypothetical protein